VTAAVLALVEGSKREPRRHTSMVYSAGPYGPTPALVLEVV
jgi:hypothetical protein